MRPKHINLVPDNRRFSDLRQWEDLYAYCIECGRKSPLNKYALGKKYGTDTIINTLKPRLTCQCLSRTGVFGTVNQDR